MRMIGPLYRAFYSAPPVRRRAAPWMRGHEEVDTFSPDGRGLGPAVALAEANRRRSLAGARSLLIGAGAGGETDLLAAQQVSSILGADLESHPLRWRERRLELARAGVQSAFSLMDGGALGLRDDSVDLVFSQSVLEHVVNLEEMAAETARVLTPEGRFVAWFGPLWSTFGGPHIAELTYEHLLVSDAELMERARSLGEGWEYWLELGLFNRLRYQDYLDILGRHFDIEWIGVAGSADGLRYRDAHPDAWERLSAENDEFDLLARLVGIVAKPL